MYSAPTPLFPFEEERGYRYAAAGATAENVLDTRRRIGKAVTVIYGFKGMQRSWAPWESSQNYCGTGGSCKDGIACRRLADKVLQCIAEERL